MSENGKNIEKKHENYIKLALIMLLLVVSGAVLTISVLNFTSKNDENAQNKSSLRYIYDANVGQHIRFYIVDDENDLNLACTYDKTIGRGPVCISQGKAPSMNFYEKLKENR